MPHQKFEKAMAKVNSTTWNDKTTTWNDKITPCGDKFLKLKNAFYDSFQ
jgi:hypothetical protein